MAQHPIGPVAYDEFRQRVRRHRRDDVLFAVAELNAQFERATIGQDPPPDLPNVVQPFSLAGVARTALVAGNDHRNMPVERQDLVEMCAYYANVDEPAIDQDPDMAGLRMTMNHIAYEQFDAQFSLMENIGRTVALLVDHAPGVPGAPSADQWAAALGVPLELFIRLGIAMDGAAIANRGRIDRQVLTLNHVAPIFTPLTADEALAVIERWFAATPDELRAIGADEETRGLEKWSLSPLVARPIVKLTAGRYVIPWPRLVLDRITPTGLYFIGRSQFGPAFPDSLGAMFEDYVGTQLRLLQHAEIRPEIVYGRTGERTVDYFVITPEVVVLVEVKAARPIRATRLGEPPGDDDTVKKIGKAFTQIERTARLLVQAHPSLTEVPNDRPLRGLVVTLEPFHLLNTPLYDDLLPRPSIPTTVVSAHELEGNVAVLQDAPDVGRRLLEALTSIGHEIADLSKAGHDLPSAHNPLLAEAWQRFSEPWSTHPTPDPDP